MSDLFVTRINIPEPVIDDLVGNLNVQLANFTAAQILIKYAHWNVKGTGFFPAHKLFDKIYDGVVDATDRIGERITALGGIAKSMIGNIYEDNTLADYTANANSSVQEHIEAVANVVGELGNNLRTLAGNVNANGSENPIEETSKRDLVTQNMLLDITEELDKFLYFLEAHLRP